MHKVYKVRQDYKGNLKRLIFLNQRLALLYYKLYSETGEILWIKGAGIQVRSLNPCYQLNFGKNRNSQSIRCKK